MATLETPETTASYLAVQQLLSSSRNVTFDAPRLFWLLLSLDIHADIGMHATGRLRSLQRDETRRFAEQLPDCAARTRLCQIFSVDPSTLPR